MKFNITVVIIGLLLLVASREVTYGQSYLNKKLYPGMNRRLINSRTPLNHQIVAKWTYYAGTGIATYFGDLCATGDCFNKSNYQFNLGLKYRFNSRFSVGGGFRDLRITGSDAKNGTIDNGRATRNLSFVDNVQELNLMGYFDILPIFTGYRGSLASQFTRRRPIVPYAFAGFSVIHFNPYAPDQNGVMVALHDLPTEQNKSYSLFAGAFTYGVGVRFKVADYMDIGVDGSYTITTTDYLDDVSGKYPTQNQDQSWVNANQQLAYLTNPVVTDLDGKADPNAWQNVNNRRPGGSPRGNSSNKDGYLIVNVRVELTVTKLGDIFSTLANGGGAKRRLK